MENLEISAVKKVCRQQIAALITKDMDLLDQIIDPDAVFFHITGKRQTKAEWFKQIRIGRMTYFNSQELALTVEGDGNHAFAHMSNAIEARIYGFRNIWLLGADIKLRKVNDEWKIIESKSRLL